MIQQDPASFATTPVTHQGNELSPEQGQMAPLRESTALLGDGDALRERMEKEGYLFLRGVLNTEWVLDARRSLLSVFREKGFLDPEAPLMDARIAEGMQVWVPNDLATKNPEVNRLLYSGEMMDFWECFFGEEVAHFDFTWLRAKAPADQTVTEPHCDTVFMNRGTENLYTCWTPLGDVKLDQGGLMILSQSHHQEDVLGEYWKMDVDEYCLNGPEAEAIQQGDQLWQKDKSRGFFHEDAFTVQEHLGGVWLTAEYRPGDMLVFGMHTLHAAADNQSKVIRLSTDSRYQPASEPQDERWIGADPLGHGPNAKRGLIC